MRRFLLLALACVALAGVQLARTGEESIFAFRTAAHGNGPHALPLRLSSLTVVDPVGTPFTRRIAAAVAEEARRDARLRHVDVRVLGDPETDFPLGDQIFLIDALDVMLTPTSAFDPWARARVALRGLLSDAPDHSYGTEGRDSQGARSESTVTGDLETFGLPFAARQGLADRIAELLNVPGALAELAKSEDVVPSYPAALLAPGIDLGRAGDVLAAFGGDARKVYAGRRHQRKGEALWRYDGEDALERVESAVAALTADGWEREDRFGAPVFVSPEQRWSHVRLRRADEFVRFQRDVQREHFASRAVATLPPTVWIHFRNEPSTGELKALHARAKALGSSALSAFEANLPCGRRTEIGISGDE